VQKEFIKISKTMRNKGLLNTMLGKHAGLTGAKTASSLKIK
jgi:hypothetical protein